MIRPKWFVTTLVLSCLCLARSGTANAAFKVEIDVYKESVAGSGNYDTLVSTNTATDPGNTGSITYSVSGSGKLNLTLVANSNRTDPDGNPAQLSQVTATIQNKTTTREEIVIRTTDTDYTIPNGPNPMTLTSSLGVSSLGKSAISGSFQSGVDVNNAEFNMATTTTSQNIVAPPGPNDQFTQFDRNGAYSISNQFTIFAAGSMTASADMTGTSEVTAAPAPGGLILAAGAIPFFGLLRRMRRAGNLIA